MSGKNSQFLNSFGRVKNKIVQDNQAIQTKIDHNNLAIDQLFNMVRILTNKSLSSVTVLCQLGEQLCRKIEQFNPHDSQINAVRLRMEEERAEWSRLDSNISERSYRVAGRSDWRPKPQKQIFKQSQTLSQLSLPDQIDMGLSDLNFNQSFMEQGQIEGSHNAALIKTEESVNYKMDLQMQHFQIKQFTRGMLAPMMEYAPNSIIPKKSVLNLYLRWNKEMKRELKITDTGKIQMQLTNQIKACFPNIVSIRQKFKGLRFKLQHEQAKELTDRVYGPLMLNDQSFKKDYVDPVDELLRQHGEKSDTQSLYSESQLNKILKVKDGQ